MHEPGSISILIEDLKLGDDDAIRTIWDRFFEPLRLFARTKLPIRNRRVVDDEDIASCAINSFQDSLRKGKYPGIKNRDDIWKFLVTVVDRNSIDCIRRQKAMKRGGGMLRGESVFHDLGESSRGLECFGKTEVSSEAVVDFIDKLDHLLTKLDEEELKTVLLARLVGDSIDEIAEKVGKSISSVERKLKIIRKIWMSNDAL